jgi:hypothetical protein
MGVDVTYVYPQHEKLHVVKAKSQAIGEFLEWLTTDQGWFIARWSELDPGESGVAYGMVMRPDTNKLLAEFFDIDLKVLEEEKLAMLAELRKMNVVK